MKDYSEFPEIVSHVEVVDADGRVLVGKGEVLSPEFVAWSLSREGRHKLGGHSFLNPIPMEPPIGYVEHVPLHEQIAAMVRRELSGSGEEAETEDEANDFEVGDDFDPSSPWEVGFEPTMSWSEAVKDIVRRAKEEYPDSPAPSEVSPSVESKEAPPSPSKGS